MSNELSQSLSNSISSEVTSIISSSLEVGLDSIMNDGLLKDIPFVSAAVSVYKIGHTIYERHLIRKLEQFILALNQGVIDEEQREKYRKKINSKNRNQELEYVLLIIDKFLDLEKPQKLANLFLAYLDESITWNDFAKCSEIIDRFLPGDFSELTKGEWHDIEDNTVSDTLLRLISFGLIYSKSNDITIQNTIGALSIPSQSKKDYFLTAFGELFLNNLNH
jgi:hypothetical protein